jgi:hypothetical protein
MENERVPAPKRRLAARARVLRRGRIFARLREGWAYDEIAEEEGATAERIRQIVREALKMRLLDEETDHAKLQLARLQPAMRIAAMAVADGHIKAINPLLKVLDRLDRYQRTAKVNHVYDDEARQKLLDKLNRVAANLGYDREIAAAEEAQGQGSGETAGPGEAKEKTPWGGRRKPLKRLDPDKGIQANSFARLWPGLAGFG